MLVVFVFPIKSFALLIAQIIGFVTDLVVDDDPEMSWQDYFRLSKSSNETRWAFELRER